MVFSFGLVHRYRDITQHSQQSGYTTSKEACARNCGPVGPQILVKLKHEEITRHSRSKLCCVKEGVNYAKPLWDCMHAMFVAAWRHVLRLA